MDIRLDTFGIKRTLLKTKAEINVINDAMAEALTVVALRARKAQVANAKERLDRPTPFALKSFAARKAQKVGGELQSRIFVLGAMESIFSRLEFGGNEDSGKGIAEDRLKNRFGGLGRNPIRRILKREPNSFIANINGKEGVFQREQGGREIRMLVSFEKNVKYRPMLNYEETARKAGETFLQEAQRQLSKRQRQSGNR